MDLPSELASVHPIFYISLLKKCIGDPTSIVPFESVEVKESVSRGSDWNLDCQVQKLRNKEVALVKILWSNQFVKGAT